MIEAGFGRADVTPRVGVELCGFGPFINRKSIAVRDRLWARAMAVRKGPTTLIVVSCDLVGVTHIMTQTVRRIVCERTGVPEANVLVHCTHTHSAPNTFGNLIGWGAEDPPYRELLPGRIAQACIAAVNDLAPAEFRHGTAPCEHIALNREYDRDAPPLAEVLREDWRPAKPELTDTTCHVLTVYRGGQLAGFVSHFSCHPVVCCEETRYIHGDFCGVATNALEREYPGSTGLFLQGAQGDVNSCCVHKPEQESLLALDVIAARYAGSVRQAMAAAKPFEVDVMRSVMRPWMFSRKNISLEQLDAWLAEQEAILAKPGASDTDYVVRMAMVHATTLRSFTAKMRAGQSLDRPIEVYGLRLGPLSLLASPFEIFQAIKRDIVKGAKSAIPLVVGISNDGVGYAPDHEAAKRGGYAADTVPMMTGQLPFANIHDELVRAMLEIDAALVV